MTSATATPLGLIPVTRSFFRSASLQLPIPVSLSGVMFAANTVNGGASNGGPPPDNALSNIGPLGPRGVWQLWQVIRVSTRYLPRSTGDCAFAAVPAPAITDAATIALAKGLNINALLIPGLFQSPELW